VTTVGVGGLLWLMTPRNFAAEGHACSANDHRHRGSIRRRATVQLRPAGTGSRHSGPNQTRSGYTSSKGGPPNRHLSDAGGRRGCAVEMPATGISAQPGRDPLSLPSVVPGQGKSTLLQRISDRTDDVVLEPPAITASFLSARGRSWSQPMSRCLPEPSGKTLRLGGQPGSGTTAEMRRLLDDAGSRELTPDTAVGHGLAAAHGPAARCAASRCVTCPGGPAPPACCSTNRPRGLDASTAQRMLWP